MLLAVLFALGCAKDPAKEEAQRVARDRVLLTAVVDQDLAAERALLEVGNVERQHRLSDAARLVDDDAIPAADRAIERAQESLPESAWGRARKDELLAAMLERRDELPRYAAALRAEDLEAQLASVEKQLSIEKRAMAVARAIHDGAAHAPMP